jgi:hypothetical protein
MKHAYRSWLEAATGATALFLFLLGLIWRDWAEGVFGWNPDRHGGGLEGCIGGVLLGGACALLGGAWRRRRRGRAGSAAAVAVSASTMAASNG